MIRHADTRPMVAGGVYMLQRPKRLVIGSVIGSAMLGAALILPEIYQSAGRTVPDWMFYLARGVVFAVIAVGAPVWFYIWAVDPAKTWLKSKRYQWPLVDKNSPPLYKKLLDMEALDRRELLTCIHVTSYEVARVNLEGVKPMLRFYITMWNQSVFTILIGPICGQVKFCERPFLEVVEDANKGWRAVQRRQAYRFEITQNIEPERVADVWKAFETGKITVYIGGLKYRLKLDEPNAEEIELSFGIWEPITFTVMGT
jgi:hypothetical protein